MNVKLPLPLEELNIFINNFTERLNGCIGSCVFTAMYKNNKNNNSNTFENGKMYVLKRIPTEISTEISESKYQKYLENIAIRELLIHEIIENIRNNNKNSNLENIIKCYGYWVKQLPRKHYLLCVEHCNGGDLCDHISQKSDDKELFTEKEVMIIMKQIIIIIKNLHKENIIHRDLKLENLVFIKNNDNIEKIKLIDFGHACLMNEDDSVKKIKCGTKHYQAPEMIHGQPVNEKCDIFSLGAIMYYMLTAKLLPEYHTVDNDSPMIVSSCICISKCALDLLQKMLIIDPNKRIGINEILEHNWFVASKTLVYQKFSDEYRRNIKSIIYDYLIYI